MHFPSPAPRTVARVLVPAAMLLLLLGMAISARIYYSAHSFKPGEVVLSDFESCEENPDGYAAAAAGTALAYCLLFPAALLFPRAFRGSWWSASGSCIYGAACATGVVMAARASGLAAACGPPPHSSTPSPYCLRSTSSPFPSADQWDSGAALPPEN